MSRENNDLVPYSNNDLWFFPRGFLSGFMNDKFWDLWDSFGFGNFGGFKVDVREKKDAFIIEAEMPGMDKNNIDIDISDHMLTISAHVDEEKEQKDNDGHYIRRERRVGSFQRSFPIDNVKTEEVHAEMKNGILTIICPKKTESLPRSKRIQIQ